MTQYVQQKVATMERPVTAWALVGIAISLVCLYAYFVNASIVNIVAAKGMQSQISSLTSDIGELEASYLSAKQGLSEEYAHSLGFVAADDSIAYIAKHTDSSLSFNR